MKKTSKKMTLSRSTIRTLTDPTAVVGGNLPIPGPPRSFGGEDSCFSCACGPANSDVVTCLTCNC